MKTVWTVLSDNEIMDRPCVAVFDSYKKANQEMGEMLKEYVREHGLDPDTFCAELEANSDGFYYRFTGGEWEEWIYISETEIK